MSPDSLERNLVKCRPPKRVSPRSACRSVVNMIRISDSCPKAPVHAGQYHFIRKTAQVALAKGRSFRRPFHAAGAILPPRSDLGFSAVASGLSRVLNRPPSEAWMALDLERL